MRKHQIPLAVLFLSMYGFQKAVCADILIHGFHRSQSHAHNLAYLGAALIKHGHSVDVLTFTTGIINDVYTEIGLPILELMATSYINADVLSDFYGTSNDHVSSKLLNTDAAFCDALFQHKEYIRDTLKSYDMAVTTSRCRCCIMLLQYVGIPHVLLHVATDAGYATDIPAPLSYYPIERTTLMLTDKMTFLNRLQNTLASILVIPVKNNNIAFTKLYHKHNVIPERHLLSNLHILVKDFAIDYVHPLGPNVIPIGLLTARPANNLSTDLEEFMHSSGNEGVIVVSIGTVIKHLPKKTLDIILSTLARFPQKTVFSYRGSTPPGLGDNVKIVKWFNQNDILGHPKTRLFLTHGGASSYREAMYHGVPIVCIPLLFDQFDTAAKIKYKGVGTYVKMKSLNNENLYEAMVDVLSNEKYSYRAKQLSAIVKDVPMNATETAVFWIEHVIKHGVNHLNVYGKNLSVIEYYLVDVITVIVVTISFTANMRSDFALLLLLVIDISGEEQHLSENV
ncbi:2-hydroxyacylsphingosine 1-beta-galactosyltransferase-like [Saccoglossus kowalevskii]|uniref:UDP-glucuronosyltransferase n=1 Tax=Saccoglossus kowalevskii TaxID=10224 RepID=A0ABM0H1I8_SACKO|nr:PREDICTED: 2-hydroxyacylsphingosine 1-beta-galactosyltransferase-like [Saccoglossus kowalevskii]